MMDIRFYDFEFNLLYIENEIISASWYLKYNGIGTFEGHFPMNSRKVKAILENEYIVLVQGDLQAIVTGKRISGNELIIYGRTVNWLLSKRVTPNFSTYKLDIGTNAEDIARWVVSNAFSDVDNFVLADKTGLTYEKHFWRNVYNPTSEVIKDCLDNAGAGHMLVFDRKNKQWVFRIFTGTEKPLVISTGNKNAYAVTYNEDLQDYISEGWYEKTIAVDENSEAVWELVSGENEKTGIYRWEGVLSAGSQSEAVSSLKNRQWKRDSEVSSTTLKYGRDYGLGDIVRVQYEFGGYKADNKRKIVGVKIWDESGNSGEMPVFGDV